MDWCHSGLPNHPTVFTSDELKYWNVLRTSLLPHVCSWWIPRIHLSLHYLCCMSADLCVSSVGSGVTQREDLARLQRAARCEEDDFHRVSLQQPAKALWSAAVRPRLWPHEQVGFSMAVLFLTQEETLHQTHTALHLYCTTVWTNHYRS